MLLQESLGQPRGDTKTLRVPAEQVHDPRPCFGRDRFRPPRPGEDPVSPPGHRWRDAIDGSDDFLTVSPVHGNSRVRSAVMTQEDDRRTLMKILPRRARTSQVFQIVKSSSDKRTGSRTDTKGMAESTLPPTEAGTLQNSPLSSTGAHPCLRLGQPTAIWPHGCINRRSRHGQSGE